MTAFEHNILTSNRQAAPVINTIILLLTQSAIGGTYFQRSRQPVRLLLLLLLLLLHLLLVQVTATMPCTRSAQLPVNSTATTVVWGSSSPAGPADACSVGSCSSHLCVKTVAACDSGQLQALQVSSSLLLQQPKAQYTVCSTIP
jgi:hypothetical protein